jgi:hypothetical protein
MNRTATATLGYDSIEDLANELRRILDIEKNLANLRATLFEPGRPVDQKRIDEVLSLVACKLRDYREMIDQFTVACKCQEAEEEPEPAELPKLPSNIIPFPCAAPKRRLPTRVPSPRAPAADRTTPRH